MNGQHFLADVINGTKLSKHQSARDSNGKAMSTSDLAKLPKDISLDRLVEACKRRGADVHDVIARALTDEVLIDEKSGMNIREQAKLAWQILNKVEPDKKALDIDANIKGTLQIGIVRFSDTHTPPVEAATLPDADMGGAGAGL